MNATGDLPALLPVPRCGCCHWWRRSKHQRYRSEAKLRPVFEGSGSPFIEGWCGVMCNETKESTYCQDWEPARAPSPREGTP